LLEDVFGVWNESLRHRNEYLKFLLDIFDEIKKLQHINKFLHEKQNIENE
jgi:hypothetical protein